MTSLVKSDILRLVARLVLGYLDEQNLPEAYNEFCETSRHLTKEYLAYREGAKSIDTSIGLVNIISEYFLLKEKLNEFVRTCPKTKLILQLIDTSSIQLRLELIFKVLKENLPTIDGKIEDTVTRKRKKAGDDKLFNISQSNTSTPESSAQPSRKRRKISLTTPFISLSASNNSKAQSIANKSALNRKELNYLSSPDTSNKDVSEDEIVEEEEEEEEEVEVKATSSIGSKISPLPPEFLSQTLLENPDFAETLAEIINKTRSAKELESSEASTSHNALTQTDVQDILSKTENDFEDILNEVIHKYLDPKDDKSKEEIDDQPSSASSSVEVVKPNEIPIKQRLRPRSVKKVPLALSEKFKKKKINVLSNEPYTGPLPACLNQPATTSTPIIVPQSAATEALPPPIFVSLVPILQSSSIFPSTSSTFQLITAQDNFVQDSVQVIVEDAKINEMPPTTDLDKENKINEKVLQTPKVPIRANFLESKCKSTPRRKATHVRILDFNHAPSIPSIKEFSTPSNGIKVETPGSAPPSVNLTKQKNTPKAEKAREVELIEIIDDSSNSTSISNTPKVAKNRRQRKIEIDSKKESPSKDPPMTVEEWDKMRAEQKSLSVDQRMRILISKEKDVKDSTKVKRRKTPKKKNLKVEANNKATGSNLQQSNGQNGKKLAPRCAKFKVTSPRKAALLRKTPKKKKSKSPAVSMKSPVLSMKSPAVSVMSILTPNIDVIKQKKTEDKLQVETIEEVDVVEKPQDTSDLNRSDSVQEVATLLTHLPETILAKTNSRTLDEKSTIDPNTLMETPLKMDCSISPLPNTPRFAVPLVTTSSQETPTPKAVKTLITATTAISSIVKHCDILTPSFPITPGFKDVTPLKNDQNQSPTSGYSSRRTDYSSCSSYYKPDESEEITRNIESIIKKARSHTSQSESDNGAMMTIEEHSIKIRAGSTKKVKVPGAMDRVVSFSEDQNKEIQIPHYTMMEEGLLSESIATTASDSDSDSDSSSSFTCSTCSTDPSTDNNVTMELFNQSDIPEDDARDSEWHCEKIDEVAESNSLIDEKTGELRFPLRNLMTPRKVDEEIKTIIEEAAIVETKESENEVKNRFASNLEAVKQRTLRIIKGESAVSKRSFSKFKKSNAKSFKVPAEQPRQIPQSRREQILSQNLSNRSRPTPLQLIPSAATSSSSSSLFSSSSRRKSATPRKTIVIDDLPKAPSPLKKQKKSKKKSESPMKPSPVKHERISLENISDNAVMHDDHPSLNISTSFNEENNSEHEIENTSNTVIKNSQIEVKKNDDEGSNTFQKAMIEQGFNKKDVEELEKKLVEDEPLKADEEEEKKEEGQLTESDDDEEEEEGDDCVLVLSDVLDNNIFNFKEESTSKRVKKSYDSLTKFPPSKCKIDGNVIKFGFSEIMDLFSMAPAKSSSKDADKNNSNKRREDNSKSKSYSKTRSSGMRQEKNETSTESKMISNDMNIDKILSMIHGSK